MSSILQSLTTSNRSSRRNAARCWCSSTLSTSPSTPSASSTLDSSIFRSIPLHSCPPPSCSPKSWSNAAPTWQFGSSATIASLTTSSTTVPIPSELAENQRGGAQPLRNPNAPLCRICSYDPHGPVLQHQPGILPGIL